MSNKSLSVFTPRGGASWAEPWSMYAELRAGGRVHHVVPKDRPDEDYYVLPRHADVSTAARDHELYSSAQGLTLHYGDLDMIGLGENPPMVMQDPPSHTAFRKLVSRGFTPRQVTAIEPAVRAFVVERVERLREMGSGDIIAELFKPLPSMVVAHYLGVPAEDRMQFDGWTDAIVAAAAESGGDFAAVVANTAETVAELMTYFTGLIERRRTAPEDDVVSHLVAAGVGADGDISGTLSILGFTFTMVAGGNDTTTGLLGGATQLLHQHPAQRERLAADLSLINGAVEEFLRLTSPVQGLCRTVTRDVTIDDTTIPAGRKALLLYASANRDEREYGPDAEELDIDRNPRNIMSFSNGAHHCLGAAAARMQARVTLEELLTRIPNFTVDLDGVTWATGAYVRRPLTVPFEVA